MSQKLPMLKTSKASIKFMKSVEGGDNFLYELLQKCFILTPELAKMAKSISKPNPFSKSDGNSAHALICYYFPTKYSFVIR